MLSCHSRLFNRPAATSESAFLRQFKHGKTELTQCCTNASLAFMRVMSDPKASVSIGNTIPWFVAVLFEACLNICCSKICCSHSQVCVDYDTNNKVYVDIKPNWSYPSQQYHSANISSKWCIRYLVYHQLMTCI